MSAALFGRGRTKKLIVAFHFLDGNQAAWKCDECRKAGLEKRRRCGWRVDGQTGSPRVVWAGGGVATDTCPRSYVTAQSVTWIEEFLVRRKLGGAPVEDLDARTAEAFLVLMEQMEGRNDR